MAMTGTIKVDPRKLKSTATAFNATGNQVKNITNQMTSIVNSLSGAVWSGDAANKYKKKFGQLENDIAKMIKMINEHVEDLNEMANEYIIAEKANENAGNSLSGNVIV